MDKQIYTLNVDGMHCAACEFYLEDKLKAAPGIMSVKADLAKQTVTIESDSSNDANAIASSLSALVAANGYTLSANKTNKAIAWHEFKVAAPAAAAFILAFALLQRLGLVNLITTSHVTYGTAFALGLIASVSTCLAVVGGLILSVSANAAKSGGRWTSQILFHVGRLGGFFVLGGVIGTLGRVFQLSFVGSAVLSIGIALVMLTLGLNLLETFPSLSRLQLRLPKRVASHASKTSELSHRATPLLAGIATFFLPCGFTQSMQLYTLTTGNYLIGGLTMLAFALGTLPVLALLSFSAFEISHKPWKGTFFKTVGLVVIVMAIYNIWNGLITLAV